jgi:hypothetical protein
MTTLAEDFDAYHAWVDAMALAGTTPVASHRCLISREDAVLSWQDPYWVITCPADHRFTVSGDRDPDEVARRHVRLHRCID